MVMIVLFRGAPADSGIVVREYFHSEGPGNVFFSQYLGGGAAGYKLPGDHDDVTEVLSYHLIVVEHGNYGSAFGFPVLNQLPEIIYGLEINGVKGLIQNNDPGVLQYQSGKESPLNLAAGKSLQRFVFHSGEPDLADCVLNFLAVGGGDSPEPSGAFPESGGDELGCGKGEGFVYS